MPRHLDPDLSLEGLRKEAKRWLKAIRANDQPARARLARAIPNPSPAPTLRDVQHALAREFGLGGWTTLKQAVVNRTNARASGAPSLDEAVTEFLDNACPDHHVRGGSDHIRAEHTAMRLLLRYPEIATANFYTAVVCGDLEAVTRTLAADPGWARRPNGEPGKGRTDAGSEGDLAKRGWGSKGWEPLSYLCFTRLSLPSVTENAVAIARALMDRGADPNVYFMAGASSYTPLTGVIGEGEEGRPPHQERDALVRLLLERGANPYDTQVVYNIHFNGKVLWYLKLIYDHAQRTGRAADWADPEWQMLNAGGYGTGARWFLDAAVEHNDAELAEWCLSHGANPNSAPGPQRRNRQRPLYEEAVFRGHIEVAEVLVRYGARRTSMALNPTQTLITACLRGDRTAIRDEIARHPEFLKSHEALFAAARHNRREAAELLLDLGTSPDAESPQGERALHIAAYDDAVDVGELLIARGAEVDPIGRQYNNTPLGGAMHCQSARMIALLGRHSRSAWEVGYSGHVDRLRELLEEKPERARGYDGETLLMYLPPDDEAKAMEVARLLIEHGADPAIRDPEGNTAADRAERNAMYEVAAYLREVEARSSGH
ncbi:MAG: ankyrin repeat domain-containing protein [Acidobacteriota bacterium]